MPSSETSGLPADQEIIDAMPEGLADGVAQASPEGSPLESRDAYEARYAADKAERDARQAEARGAVATVNAEQAAPEPPPARDAEGGNDYVGYSTGNRAAHLAERSAAADAYNHAQGIPTQAEKSAMLADKSRPTWRKVLDRLRGR